MEKAKLIQRAYELYGVQLSDNLSKDQINAWIRQQRNRITFPNASSQGPNLNTITPRIEDIAIKSEPIILYPSATRSGFIHRQPRPSDNIPTFGGPVPPSQLYAVEDENFNNANAKGDEVSLETIDLKKLTTEPGGYTIPQLSKFLAELGLKRTGTKEELIARIKEELNPKLETYDIDVFDFDTYQEEFDKFKTLFTGTELYLRAAIYILYKYTYLRTTEEKDKLEQEYQASQDKKKFLETMTNVFDIRDLLARWYSHFNPEKLTPEFIDKTMDTYIECEDVLFNRLYRRYIDKSIPERNKLWFAECKREIGADKKKENTVVITEKEPINPTKKPESPTEEEDIFLPERTGLLEEIQEGAIRAKKINLAATFQPKTAFLPPPTAPRTRARIVTPRASTTTKGERGVAISTIFPVTPVHSLEMSKPGQRKTTPVKAVEEEEEEKEINLTDFIDPKKLILSRGGYTVDQLKNFLGQLNLKKTGTKENLIERLKEALGYD